MAKKKDLKKRGADDPPFPAPPRFKPKKKPKKK